jgi:hypothetical protein
MSETTVILNQNVTPGSAVAVFSDSVSRLHQEVIIQTQSGASDPVSVSAANPVPVAGTVGDGVADTGSGVKVAGVYNSTPVTVANGQRCSAQVDANGYWKVNIAAGAAAGGTSSTFGAAVPSVGTAIGFTDGTNLQLGHVDGAGNLKVNVSAGGVPAGQDNTSFTAGSTQGLPMVAVADSTNSVGNVTQGNEGIPKMTVDRKLFVSPQANPIGGWSPAVVITTASTNASVVKASAGSLGVIAAINTTATLGFLKLYNKATTPAPGTDTPVWSVPIPANTSGAGVVIPIPAGISFATGIGIAVTGAIALNDATNGPAGIAVNLGFI